MSRSLLTPFPDIQLVGTVGAGLFSGYGGVLQLSFLSSDSLYDDYGLPPCM